MSALLQNKRSGMHSPLLVHHGRIRRRGRILAEVKKLKSTALHAVICFSGVLVYSGLRLFFVSLFSRNFSQITIGTTFLHPAQLLPYNRLLLTRRFRVAY